MILSKENLIDMIKNTLKIMHHFKGQTQSELRFEGIWLAHGYSLKLIYIGTYQNNVYAKKKKAKYYQNDLFKVQNKCSKRNLISAYK